MIKWPGYQTSCWYWRWDISDRWTFPPWIAEYLPELQSSSSTQVKIIVSGEALPILGWLEVSLEIAKGIYPCDFNVVSNLSYEAVLARDFLCKHGVMIDLKNGKLKLEDAPTGETSKEACPVNICYTCVIPPQLETIIPAYLGVSSSPGDVGLLKASRCLGEQYQLQGLANPSQQSVTLYRGATLGTFQQIDDDPEISSQDETSSQSTEITINVENVPIDLDNAELTEVQKAAPEKLVNEYRDVFALSPDELDRTNLVQHHIDSGDHPPIPQRPYRVPVAQKERIQKCIDDMLEQGIISSVS